MDSTVLHLKLVRGVRGVSFAYVVWRHIKVPHIPPEYGAFLNLDEEMIIGAPTVNEMSNLRFAQDSLYRIYFDHKHDAFKIDNPLVYQILSKIFTDMDTYV